MSEEIVGKGVMFLRLGRYEAAMEFFRKALEVNPNDDDAWAFEGISLKELGRHEEALKSFYKAFEIEPKSKYAILVATVLYDLKRYGEAMDFLNVVRDGGIWNKELVEVAALIMSNPEAKEAIMKEMYEKNKEEIEERIKREDEQFLKKCEEMDKGRPLKKYERNKEEMEELDKRDNQ
ncbi:MAG: tetratricopeptide repeat protein [Proteobacteria bacterium]|nr:tetratricopeptide repeat protein [Pseudomonadota bacterium]